MEKNNSLIHLLKNRVSTPAAELTEPAPDDTQIRQILQAAVSVPDHGNLVPYRFVCIRGEARQALSTLFVQALKKRNPQATEAQIKKQAAKPLRSPLILVVVARLQEQGKIPLAEQKSTAAAVTMQLMLAANALGFGSIWLTGDHAYDWTVKEALGLTMEEEITAFVYLGTPKETQPQKQRPAIEPLLSEWFKPVKMESRF